MYNHVGSYWINPVLLLLKKRGVVKLLGIEPSQQLSLDDYQRITQI